MSKSSFLCEAEVRALRVGPQDVVVITADASTDAHKLRSMAEAVRMIWPKNLVLILADGQTIESLPRDDLLARLIAAGARSDANDPAEPTKGQEK